MGFQLTHNAYMDYEQHPTEQEHPFVAVAFLRESGSVDEEIIDAILGHAVYSGVPRTTPMARHLFACDELAGFIKEYGQRNISVASEVLPDGED